MADWIEIPEGPYQGRYEFDIAEREFTTREWGWIKKYSGYLPLTIDQGWRGGDAELFACFAMIAVRRANRIELAEVSAFMERMLDGAFGSSFTFTSDGEPADEGDADGPPAASSPAKPSTDGTVSETSSEGSGNGQSHSGIPGSATSVYDPAMWGS
jgi:hypothetical protein